MYLFLSSNCQISSSECSYPYYHPGLSLIHLFTFRDTEETFHEILGLGITFSPLRNLVPEFDKNLIYLKFQIARGIWLAELPLLAMWLLLQNNFSMSLLLCLFS